LYTCKETVKFFSTKALIINKKVYNFIFSGSVKFSGIPPSPLEVHPDFSSGRAGVRPKLYTCKESVKFFSTKALIINKNVYNFIFPAV